MNKTFKISCNVGSDRYVIVWETNIPEEKWKSHPEVKKQVIKDDAAVCVMRNIDDEGFRSRHKAVISDEDCDVKLYKKGVR
tara:strand:- start:41 stop:283 length:243 start_codon:yes stop_codon:yes gene_type:complete